MYQIQKRNAKHKVPMAIGKPNFLLVFEKRTYNQILQVQEKILIHRQLLHADNQDTEKNHINHEEND